MESKYYKVMGLDYGDARIGIAMSDIMGIIASGLETFTRVNLEKDCKHIAEIAKSNNVKIIVFGLPVNMDGTSGIRVQKTLEFAETLKSFTEAKIEFIDERLTTVAAEKMLIGSRVSREKRKDVIDKVAAAIILQNYLDTHKRS